MELPSSPSFERNKEPILQVLKEVIGPEYKRLLEIGAGTGEHALYFAPYFPYLEWFPTDRAAVLARMNQRLKGSQVSNLMMGQKLEVGQDDFPRLKFDLVFTANTFHIMHWKECKTLIKLLGHRLRENSKVLIYGPFNYGGQFTSPSNEEFDRSLKEKDPLSGIRSFEDVDKAMVKQGFELVADYEMPANNRLLVYNRLKFIAPKPSKK